MNSNFVNISKPLLLGIIMMSFYVPVESNAKGSIDDYSTIQKYKVDPWFKPDSDIKVEKEKGFTNLSGIIGAPDNVLSGPSLNGDKKLKDDTKDSEKDSKSEASSSWETAVINGLADFMLERAEAELVQWFLESTLESICSGGDDQTNKVREMRNTEESTHLGNEPEREKLKEYFDYNLFDYLDFIVEPYDAFQAGKWHPTDNKYVKSDTIRPYFGKLCSVRNEYYNGAASTPSIEVLMKAFRKDLEVLPASLLANEANLYWVYSFLDVMQKVRSGVHPAYMLAGLAENERLKDCDKDKGECALLYAGIVFQAYISSRDDKDHSKIDLRKFANHIIKYKLNKLSEDILRDLLLEGSGGLAVKLKTKLNGKSAGLGDNLLKDTKGLISLNDIKAKLKENIKGLVLTDDLKKKLLAKDIFGDIMGQLSKNIDKIKLLMARIKSIDKDISNLNKLSSDKNVKSQAIIAIASRITNAILDAIKLSNEILSDKEYKKYFEERNYIEPALKVTSNFSSGQYREGLISLSELFKEIERHRENKLGLGNDYYKKRIRTLNKYLPFFVELSSAETANEVKTQLKAAASPVGTWKLKRSNHMKSIGGLLGGNIGKESLRNESEADNQSSYFTSLFAPVGLDISWPCRRKTCTKGVFLSLVDLGNVIGARFSGTEKGNVEEVESSSNSSFKNVFSPGVYFRWGLGNSPLVMGFGAAWSPELRNADLTSGGSEDMDSMRYSIFLATDIVLLPF